MSNKQNNNKPQSPAELIGQAESTIAALEGKREQLVQRVAEHASARERLSFQAHAMHDAEAIERACRRARGGAAGRAGVDRD